MIARPLVGCRATGKFKLKSMYDGIALMMAEVFTSQAAIVKFKLKPLPGKKKRRTKPGDVQRPPMYS